LDTLRDLDQLWLTIDHNHVESQKQFRRDLWDYKSVDHIPIFIWPAWAFGYTPREAIENRDLQFVMGSSNNLASYCRRFIASMTWQAGSNHRQMKS
jgi:hypothetical protein